MVWKWIDEVYKLTRVVSLAIDELVEAPTSKAKNNKIHDQVKKQQWSCCVPSNCGHFLVASDFLSSQTHLNFVDKAENFLHRFLLTSQSLSRRAPLLVEGGTVKPYKYRDTKGALKTRVNQQGHACVLPCTGGRTLVVVCHYIFHISLSGFCFSLFLSFQIVIRIQKFK